MISEYILSTITIDLIIAEFLHIGTICIITMDNSHLIIVDNHGFWWRIGNASKGANGSSIIKD